MKNVKPISSALVQRKEIHVVLLVIQANVVVTTGSILLTENV